MRQSFRAYPPSHFRYHFFMEDWLFPTPTSREARGSNRCLHRKGRDHSSIRNLDLSEIVEMITNDDPRFDEYAEQQEANRNPPRQYYASLFYDLDEDQE
jgi:hypothetical protein